MLSFLQINDRRDLYRDVWYGTIAAILASLGLAWIFLTILDGIKAYQELFEGLIMLLAAGFITWMIIWMTKQSRSIKTELEEKIATSISERQRMGLILIVFFSVAREGAELVIFLYAAYIDNYLTLGVPTAAISIGIGFTLGILVSAFASVLLFRYSYQLNTKRFFQFTSIILIIFAAGLLAHGIHEIFEFLESSSNPFAETFIWTEVWNINHTFLGDVLQFFFGWTYDPNYSSRFEKSIIGGILAGLFGWNDNPALIEVVAYLLYFLGIYKAIKWINSNSIRSNPS
ncbi:MAG: FTR1 family iron permease [Candidatus Hodarchaeales archaeon]